jgi:hypothetical protein
MVKKVIESKKLLGQKILKKPKVTLKKISAEKIILKNGNQALVKEGRTGFFNKEMVEETKWLS